MDPTKHDDFSVDLNNPELWAHPRAFLDVWDTLHPWFEMRGYILYPRDPNYCYTPRPGEGEPYDLPEETLEYPFAQTLRGDEYYRSFSAKVGLWVAVDSKHRDVVIKTVPSDYDELVIARKLSTEPMKSDPHNCIVPVLEVLQFNAEFSFIIMPRWSAIPYTNGDVFDCLETSFCFTLHMLQALAFLHENGIVHRDISFRNVLVNCNGYTEHIPPVSLRPDDKWQPRFVLCDFDISVIFPPDIPPSERVLPASETSWGELSFHPQDVSDGDATYDPFAFDVACMGAMLCIAIGPTTKAVPLLAPFLDRMITPHISSRYTASEALDAFTEIMRTLSQEFLRQTPAPPFVNIRGAWQNHDRWDGLPDDFVKEHLGPEGPVRPRRKKVSYSPDGSMSSVWVEWDVPIPLPY